MPYDVPRFNYLNAGQAIEQGNRNALMEAELREMPQQQAFQRQQNQNVLAQQDQSIQAEKIKQGIAYVQSKLPAAQDPVSWKSIRGDFIQKNLFTEQELPEAYDPTFIQRLQGLGGGNVVGSPLKLESGEYGYMTPSGNIKSTGTRFHEPYKILDVGGVPTLVDTRRDGKASPLSTLEDESIAKSELKKSEQLGGFTAKKIDDALAQTDAIRSNIITLNEVIDAVKDGAETGPISKRLPSFRAASVKLDNLRRRLGLDVVGSVTFGALSEKELEMALDVALPTDLQGPQLIQWAKDKIAAQEKLANYLDEQVAHLSQPGNSVASWREYIKRKGGGKASTQGQGIKFLGIE